MGEEVEGTIDIFCIHPAWAIKNPNRKSIPMILRLYALKRVRQRYRKKGSGAFFLDLPEPNPSPKGDPQAIHARPKNQSVLKPPLHPVASADRFRSVAILFAIIGFLNKRLISFENLF
jgi:hypothetical protein